MTTVLLAGGTGYIGSHTAIELLTAGYKVLIIDNYSNSFSEVVSRVKKITKKSVELYELNITDSKKISDVFAKNKIDVIIHFAGFKSISESIANPVMYYRNNIDTTLTLLECMKKFGVSNIIFSSSATVYGNENPVPYFETMKKGRCTNPYGWTKAMIEQIFEDAANADPDLSVIILRYFNPIGAHDSGLIGEDQHGIPNNLMPYISQVATGKRECLIIFGNDYPTSDGTCTRDYIHVVDLALGHVRAINYIMKNKCCFEIFNLGTGTPYSVINIINTFEKVNGIKLNYAYGDRRPGDLAECYANVDKALNVLNWMAKRTLDDMCRDSWNWQKNNPNGYKR